jgi:hypothetical protein
MTLSTGIGRGYITSGLQRDLAAGSSLFAHDIGLAGDGLSLEGGDVAHVYPTVARAVDASAPATDGGGSSSSTIEGRSDP